MRGLFVTGTDTGVGKTVVAAAIAAALVVRGERVAAFKPVVTGTDEATDPDWPRDDELLGAVTGQDPAAVAPLRFGPAVSPHLAAELNGDEIDPAALIRAAHDTAAMADVLIAEGVGGLLVPLTAAGDCIRDVARELGLPLVIAARPGLGTINHTLMTIEVARAGGLAVAGVVLTPWAKEPSAIEQSNRDTIGHLGGIDVATLASIARGEPSLLAAAGSGLPLARWLDA